MHLYIFINIRITPRLHKYKNTRTDPLDPWIHRSTLVLQWQSTGLVCGVCVFSYWSGYTKEYENGPWCFLAYRSTLEG